MGLPHMVNSNSLYKGKMSCFQPSCECNWKKENILVMSKPFCLVLTCFDLDSLWQQQFEQNSFLIKGSPCFKTHIIL